MPTTWKSISVFLSDTHQSDEISEQAAVLAERFGGHLIGIFSINGIPGERRGDSFARGEHAVSDVIARHQAFERAQTVTVGRRFAALSRKYDIGIEFRVIRWGRGGEEALLHSLHCDLIVLDHPNAHGLPGGWTAERLLMASGVPILVIPDDWKGRRIGTRPLVAWNASREARRAIADAMPILSTAQLVTVLVVDAARTPRTYGEEPGADIATHLARHCDHVDLQQVTSEGAPVAQVIGLRALEQGADLIVIGAYSRSRSAEKILGGTTRSLLTHLPVPALVSR